MLPAVLAQPVQKPFPSCVKASCYSALGPPLGGSRGRVRTGSSLGNRGFGAGSGPDPGVSTCLIVFLALIQLGFVLGFMDGAASCAEIYTLLCMVRPEIVDLPGGGHRTHLYPLGNLAEKVPGVPPSPPTPPFPMDVQEVRGGWPLACTYSIAQSILLGF